MVAARTLHFSQFVPPLAVIAAEKLGGACTVELKPGESAGKNVKPRLVVPSAEGPEEVVEGPALLKFIGVESKLDGLYGAHASQIDEWIDYAPTFSVGAEFEKACASVDGKLGSNKFLVGEQLSLADLAIWEQLLLVGPRWESLRKSPKPKFPKLIRWYNELTEAVPVLAEVALGYAPRGKKGASAAAAAGAAGASQQEKKGGGGKADKVEGSFDVKLPGAEEGKVVTRFPPEASGYLHVGHAKAALLNEYFARMYKGKLLIRFDDTNPAKEKEEYEESILADLARLGIKGDAPVTYTSDYFEQLLQLAERLIKEGKAYVDDTPVEQMRKERMDGIESKRRNATVEENLANWRLMVEGKPEGQVFCLRGKMDMQAANKALRDPVYYRCNQTPHNRTGSKYKLYPTYDFACPYVDSVEGVTHALRSSEYHDRNDQYYRVLDDMGVRKVHIWDFSRLNFVYTLLSKRKLQWFVENGRVDGWDDPRFPTVQGMIRRGLTVEALREFIVSQGASKNLNLMEMDKLWTINKKIVDPVCARHTAVVEEGKVLFTFANGPVEAFVKIIPRHKKYEPAGQKATTFTRSVWIDQADALAVSEGEEVTLMDWGNAFVRKVTKNEDGKVTGLEGDLHPEGSVKTTKLKLTWLPQINDLVLLNLVDFDYLITKKKLEEDDDFLSVLNPVTKMETAAVGDANMRNLKKGEIFQLERKGYFVCDVPYVSPRKPIVLFTVPDGRQRPPPGKLWC
ncbi:hypothetical protein CBR_g26306 [Chara braunii]|uniref:glutamate--tRNA ligase n=1 Tax=Chara braunii TaxID=69332 RepID=A0A388L7J7_CHABU|nr:hypothetical protein CBR_g26306 [Chara braunii]|eukprot:GBG78275.1 hypothetical protein CBR_g26306 [Chara braunii]